MELRDVFLLFLSLFNRKDLCLSHPLEQLKTGESLNELGDGGSA